MQRYNSYKHSGVQWLGEIPGHWDVVRIKHLFTEEDEKNTNLSYELLSFSRNKGIVPFSDINDKEPSANDLSKYKVIRPGQLLENRMQAWSGMFGCSHIEGCVSPDYSVFSPKPIANTEYYALLFKTKKYVQQWANESKGIGDGFNRLYTPQFFKILALLPPLAEQRAIVAYLDDKCAKIDRLLEGKAKQIALLGEMKQRLIADAVTRGLNPDVKMKPTNIQWLKEIPEGWEMSKVSSHFKQRNEKVSDKDYPALSVSKMGVTPQLENVALSNADGNSRKLVKVGDYAVNSRSDRKGSCGVSKYEGSVSLITIVLEPRDVDGGYVHYLFRSNPWIEEFYRNGRGIVADLWTTNYQLMKGMYFPLPPLSEQREIVAYINERVAKMDALAAKLQKEIDNIKEYKQRLISDVVTGQVKVN